MLFAQSIGAESPSYSEMHAATRVSAVAGRRRRGGTRATLDEAHDVRERRRRRAVGIRHRGEDADVADAVVAPELDLHARGSQPRGDALAVAQPDDAVG